MGEALVNFNMHQYNVGLLDLPNEILRIILKKLDNIHVLYSFLDVDNERLDIIAQENTFSKALNFVLTSSADDIFWLTDSIVERFCINILPRIHHNVKSLILDSVFMERILLAADYPNLTELKLFNFNDTIVSLYFTVEAPFGHIFQRQITDLILVFENDFEISNEHYSTDVYEYILKFFKNLTHLSIIGYLPSFVPPLVLRNLPSTTFFSTTLNKLCIDVKTYDDCLALLNGRLKQLTTLFIVINKMTYHSPIVYHMDDLPNLKWFSLMTPCCSAEIYDTLIPLLFHRMSNLEELHFDITIEKPSSFIDVTHICNDISGRMPRLHIFNFSIYTNIDSNRLVRHLTKDDIQQSCSNINYQPVDCIVNYRYHIATFHVFSLPFMFDCLKSVGNTFPSIIFNHVKNLTVQDDVPFEHEFFQRIAWSFPLLQHLRVINYTPQSVRWNQWNCNDNQLYSIVKYPYLISLRLDLSDDHYIDQFLNETKTHLPCLTKLIVEFYHLQWVTRLFRRKNTRLNCSKVKQLIMNGTIMNPEVKGMIRSKHFKGYFPRLKSSFCALRN